MDKINISEIKEFLQDVRLNTEITVLESAQELSDLASRAKKRGIILQDSQDLGGIKILYAPLGKANKNGARIPPEAIKGKLDTLIGKPLDVDHQRRYVIGHFIDAELDGNNIMAWAVIYKTNFEEEWEKMKALFKIKKLTHSFEIWCPADKRKYYPDGTYDLLEIVLAGGAILLNTKPAFPESKILELAKSKIQPRDSKCIKEQCSKCLLCAVKDEDIIICDTEKEFAMKFDEILENPEILKKIDDKELLSLHLRCHQLWGTETGKTFKILAAHALIILEMYNRKIDINQVDELDKMTYKMLGDKVKIFSIYDKLPDFIPLKSQLVNFVGSVLCKKEVGDIDIVCHQDTLCELLAKLLPGEDLHMLKRVVQHGEFWDAYELSLVKKSLKLNNLNPPDFDAEYEIAEVRNSLQFGKHIDQYVVEALCENYEIVVNKTEQLIYEKGIFKGKEVITDFLAFEANNFFKEMLAHRNYFMYKKWFGKLKEKKTKIPECVWRKLVEKKKLGKFLAAIEPYLDAVVIRPLTSTYYDGKFVLEFDKKNKKEKPYNYPIDPNLPCAAEELKPGKIFTPLKATGGAYHELEYFSPEDAYNFFGNHFIKEEGKFRAEAKLDGLRCILQVTSDNKPIIYFEDAKENKEENLPSIVKELKELNKNGIILDAELMEEVEPTKWQARQNLLTFTKKNPRDDKNVRIFVFDVLYYNGQDLHTKPYSERLEVLNKITKQFKEHFILAPFWEINSKEELVKLYNRNRAGKPKDEYRYSLSEGNGIDGLMLKSLSSDYPLTGKTLAWCKLKYQLELDVIILEKTKIKGDGGYKYKIGYGISEKDKDKYIPTEELNGKIFGVLGSTFNTKISAEIGKIINVGMAEIKKTEENDKIKYTLFQCRVLSEKPDKKEPDSVDVIDKMSIEVTKAIELNESNCDIIYNNNETTFFIYAKKEVNQTGAWTFEEGMKGDYAIQIHIRGIDEFQKKNLKMEDFKKMGLDPEFFRKINIDTLNSIYEADWKSMIDEATKGASTKLQKIISKIYEEVDLEKLNAEQKQALALVNPVSIHQDLRLSPDGTNYFEGGHFLNPGNQYKDNDLLTKLPEGKHCAFMIKTPHTEEKVKVQEPTIRGDKSWLSVGSPPLWSEPGGVGSTSDKWALFNRIDFGKFWAGKQKAESGSGHAKEFLFKGKYLDGRIIFMWAPIGAVRMWLVMKPKTQEPKSEFLKEKMKGK